jgi:hypothetical protein
MEHVRREESNWLTVKNKVQFDIDLASTRMAGLRFSSRMLNLAANIFGK